MLKLPQLFIKYILYNMYMSTLLRNKFFLQLSNFQVNHLLMPNTKLRNSRDSPFKFDFFQLSLNVYLFGCKCVCVANTLSYLKINIDIVTEETIFFTNCTKMYIFFLEGGHSGARLNVLC